ncbi:MAG: CDP-alcohol phosphatidyltransferase family protein [Myxococcales bacterium]|nr:CDP-alcohol phosphatidyltransferase family protein [Myxococcales bacterium]
MIKSVFGHRLDRWVRVLLPFLFWRPVNPNLLTVLGTSVSLAAAAAFALGWFVTGGLLLLTGGLFDLVDGVVARHHGVSTRFGAFLDSTLDRLSDMVLLLGIAMYFALGGEPRLVLLAGYTLVATVLVSYTQARAEISVPAFRVGILERAERVLILAAGALSGYVVVALWILAIGSTVTVAQRFARAYREMERIDAAERDSLEGNT